MTPEKFDKALGLQRPEVRAGLPHGTTRWVSMYVDGGVFGQNPSPRGVYWSLRVEGWWKQAAETVRCQHEKSRKDSLTSDWTTNNDAEWLAVREALLYAVKYQIDQPIVIYSDSKLIVNQFNGRWRIKLPRHELLHDECKSLAKRLKFVAVKWTRRETMLEKLGH